MRRLGLWALLLCTLLSIAPPAWAAPQVEMTVQASNESRVKQGGWVTVVVELTNRGGEMSGELVVETTGDFPHPQYVVPVTLPSGGRKRIPVSLEALGNQPIKVLLRSEGKEVDSRTVDLIWLPPQATLIGILSGDELGIPGLNQVQSGPITTTQIVRLSAATFPDRAALLEDYDAIALSRFDTATLSTDQLRSLEVWVSRGGTLLLAGGPEWKRTLAPLPESLVPFEVTGVREITLDPLGELAGKPLAGRGSVSEAQSLRGESLVASEGVPLVSSSQVGNGRVVYLAFDPGLNPVAGWNGQADLYNRILAGVGQGIADWPNSRTWMLQEALKRIPDWGLPGIWTIILLLGSYMLLVGPVNYLVLKRVDRREWGWATIPALSLLFVGIVYGIGFGRFEALVSHLITVTELSPGSRTGTMTSYVGLYAPARTRLTVTLADAKLVRPFNNGPTVDSMVTAKVVAGDRTTLELMNMTNYSMSGFSMEQDIPVTGGLELVDASLENGRLTARIKNQTSTPIDQVVVVVGSTVQELGRLEAGALSEPISALLGSTMAFDPRMGPARAYMQGLPSESGPDSYRRNMMRDFVLESVAGRAASRVLVMGWAEEPPASPQLPELGKMVGGANLVYAIMPLPLGEGGVDLPAGVVTGQPVDPKQTDWTSYGYLLRPGTHMFTLLLPPLDEEQVAEVTVYTRMLKGPMGLTASVRNQETGEWMPISGESLTLPSWREYVSPVGLIELRYEAQEHVEIGAPTVSVKGVSH